MYTRRGGTPLPCIPSTRPQSKGPSGIGSAENELSMYTLMYILCTKLCVIYNVHKSRGYSSSSPSGYTSQLKGLPRIGNAKMRVECLYWCMYSVRYNKICTHRGGARKGVLARGYS